MFWYFDDNAKYCFWLVVAQTINIQRGRVCSARQTYRPHSKSECSSSLIKASKQQILDKAVDTVRMIKSTELALMNRRNSLNKNNAQLKEKLRKLKEEAKISEHSNLGIGDW